MSVNYLTMWCLLILMALGAVGELVANGDIFGTIREAYPADPAKRYALHRCGETSAEFSRFSQHDRDTCYQAVLTSSQAIAW